MTVPRFRLGVDVGMLDNDRNLTFSLANRPGNPAATFGNSPKQYEATYRWPFQMHGMIGPSCAIAEWGIALSDWSNPFGVVAPSMQKSPRERPKARLRAAPGRGTVTSFMGTPHSGNAKISMSLRIRSFVANRCVPGTSKS
jgi:hypothetical protein